MHIHKRLQRHEQRNFINYWFCDTQNVSINNEIIISVRPKISTNVIWLMPCLSKIYHSTFHSIEIFQIFQLQMSLFNFFSYEKITSHRQKCAHKFNGVGQRSWNCSRVSDPSRSIFNYQLNAEEKRKKKWFEIMMMFSLAVQTVCVCV